MILQNKCNILHKVEENKLVGYLHTHVDNQVDTSLQPIYESNFGFLSHLMYASFHCIGNLECGCEQGGDDDDGVGASGQ